MTAAEIKTYMAELRLDRSVWGEGELHLLDDERLKLEEIERLALKALRPEADGGITQALVQMARDNAIEECARIADKHRGRFYEHDKYGADIGGEIRRLLIGPQKSAEGAK